MYFLFDIDDTLYSLEDPFYLSIKEFDFYESIRKEDLHRLFVSFRKYNNEIYHRALEGEISMDYLCKYRITRALSDFGVEIDEDTAYKFQMCYLDKKREIKLNPHVRNILERIKKEGHSIGIVSNGPYKEQYEKLDYLGMWDFVDREEVFVSEDVGYFKPDKRIFEAAIAFHRDEEVFYIGDSYEIDVLGALNTGIIPIWFNHRNVIVEDKKDIIEINDWKGIEGILELVYTRYRTQKFY